jgi:hypothetical protein
MNNEPVAWLLFRDGGESYPEYTTSYKQMREWETYLGDNERIEPHYTHPAKTEDEGKVCARCGAIAYDPVITQTAKTLTDEEIWGFMDEMEALVHGDIKRAMYRMARKVESILNE